MKIIKETEGEKNKCPYCKVPLEFFMNEFKIESHLINFFLLLFSFSLYDPITGNQWFHCHTCKRDFLIKSNNTKSNGGKE